MDATADIGQAERRCHLLDGRPDIRVPLLAEPHLACFLQVAGGSSDQWYRYPPRLPTIPAIK